LRGERGEESAASSLSLCWVMIGASGTEVGSKVTVATGAEATLSEKFAEHDLLERERKS